WTPGRSAAAWAATGRASSCRTRTMASRAGSRPRPPFRTRVYDDAGVVAEPLARELLCRVDLPLDGGPARVERIHVHVHLRLRRPHAVEQSARRVAWCARDVAPTRRDATRPDRVRGAARHPAERAPRGRDGHVLCARGEVCPDRRRVRERRADRARELFGRLKRVLGRLRLGDVRQHGDGALAGRPKHVLEEVRSEEHTSELQSRENLVCRLLLEKKKKKKTTYKHTKHK